MEIHKADQIIGKHNKHLEVLLRLTADEALFVGDPRHRNIFFGLTTEPTLMIEPKNIDAYSANNHLNIDVLSNAEHFVQASSSARRLFIPTVSSDKAGDLKYFEAMNFQLHDGGYEALLYHLLHEVDIRDFNPRAVPKQLASPSKPRIPEKALTCWSRLPAARPSCLADISRGTSATLEATRSAKASITTSTITQTVTSPDWDH